MNRETKFLHLKTPAMLGEPSIRFPATLPRRNEVENMNRETKFLHLKTPAMLGERINGWRVCWLGGWDRGRLFYVVMVERRSGAAEERPALGAFQLDSLFRRARLARMARTAPKGGTTAPQK